MALWRKDREFHIRRSCRETISVITKLYTAPAIEPVTAEEMKLYLRVDGTDEETLVGSLITSARRHVELITGRALITQTWDGWLDAFPLNSGEIVLPFGRVQKMNTFTYTDIDGVVTTVDATTYDLDTDSDPGRIVLKYGETWPAVTLATKNPIKINWDCGYGLAVSVPDAIKTAIKWTVADLYENRGQTAASMTPGATISNRAVEMLLAPYRIWKY